MTHLPANTPCAFLTRHLCFCLKLHLCISMKACKPPTHTPGSFPNTAPPPGLLTQTPNSTSMCAPLRHWPLCSCHNGCATADMLKATGGLVGGWENLAEAQGQVPSRSKKPSVLILPLPPTVQVLKIFTLWHPALPPPALEWGLRLLLVC